MYLHFSGATWGGFFLNKGGSFLVFFPNITQFSSMNISQCSFLISSPITLCMICAHVGGCSQLLCSILLFATPWTVACWPPLSMKFSRQEYWGGLPFPPSGDLSDPGLNSVSWISCISRSILHHCTMHLFIYSQLPSAPLLKLAYEFQDHNPSLLVSSTMMSVSYVKFAISKLKFHPKLASKLASP